jgi:hypothetical protein
MDVVAHACDHCTQETEAGGSQFEASLGYIAWALSSKPKPKQSTFHPY